MHRRLAIVGLLAALALGSGTFTASLALFSSDVTIGGNTITAGYWATPVTYYLHNDPTPPAGGTAARPNLPMNTVAPTAPVLYDYNTDCFPTGVGRTLDSRNGATRTCSTVSWLTPPLAASRQIAGTVTLSAWYRLDQDPGGKNIVVDVTLNDVDAAGVRTPIVPTQTFTWSSPGTGLARHDIASAVGGYVVAAGHQIELVIHGNVSTFSQRNIVVAYDTAAYPSSLALP